MKPPRFKVQAYLVDGNLCREESKAVAQVVVAEMKPCEVMHLSGNLCNLREEEMHVLEELLPEEETFCINSLVMTSTTQETAKVQEMISMRREEVVEEFEKDVLSGKLSKDPPVRWSTRSGKGGAHPASCFRGKKRGSGLSRPE